jgi:glycosyltransferase involved in cell wall biosynthesis
MKPTVIIPVYNEEEYLPGCLQSAKWANEIIVVDFHSTDRTVQIAEEAGATVVQTRASGFADRKNEGVKQASGDWLLFIDADERISRSLRKEIELLTPNEYTMYSIPRKNYILGKFLHHGGWYPDYQQRLVKRSDFIGWQGKLHEHVEMKSVKVGTLRQPLIHLTHRGIAWMLRKTIYYAKVEAELKLQAGHPTIRLRNIFGSMLREFWYRAVKMSGWRDGMRGWIEIFYQTFNAMVIMVYLWEMQQTSMADQYRKLRERIGDEL